VGHETFRKFHAGVTRRPQPPQLQLYRAKFLELHPSGYVQEERVDGPNALEQLKMVLPPGRENAQRVLDQLFEAAARNGEELAPEAEKVQAWMRKLLNAEYDAEGRMPPPRPPRGPRKAKKDEG
jgi:hypothetical protein